MPGVSLLVGASLSSGATRTATGTSLNDARSPDFHAVATALEEIVNSYLPELEVTFTSSPAGEGCAGLLVLVLSSCPESTLRSNPRCSSSSLPRSLSSLFFFGRVLYVPLVEFFSHPLANIQRFPRLLNLKLEFLSIRTSLLINLGSRNPKPTDNRSSSWFFSIAQSMFSPHSRNASLLGGVPTLRFFSSQYYLQILHG